MRLLLAATTAEIQAELIRSQEKLPDTSGDVLFFFGVLAAVAAVVFLAAYFYHRLTARPKRKRRGRRPRRPTLAETGGLPPVRNEPQSPPD